jgi:molybdate transport system permease protein
MDWSPLLLSFQVASIATVIAAVVGIGIGALLVNPRVPGRDVVDVLVTTPMILPPTVLGYYVLVAVGRRSAIGTAFESLTGSPIVFTRTGAVLAATLGALPLVVKSARAALEAVDPVLVQVARTLGAGAARSFFAVRLPLASGGIIAGLMLAFARSLGDFGVTLMIAGDIPGETQTASLAIFGAIQANREEEALGMIAVLSVVAVVTLYTTNKLAAKSRVG